MPRSARIIVDNCPHHVIQRGHNRQVVFTADEDYLFYLENLGEWKERFGCKIYAYCLMTNHVHLIVDPGESANNLALLMKRIAGRQTRYLNRVTGRSGTLWEGRYKSSPISTNEYLLACNRYIELNPVRAGMVSSPEEYRWSSCQMKTGLAKQDWLDFDADYLELGSTAEERQEKYRSYLKATIPEEQISQIRGAIQRGQLTGNDTFVKEVEAKLGKRIEFRGQGRPKKPEK